MFSRAPLAGAWGIALVAAMSAAAHAQLAEQVFASVSGGVTNNALLAPDSEPSQIVPDVFTAVRAGLQTGYTGRRSDQTLAYSYGGTFYADHPQGDVQSHDLGWRFHATPTGTTDLRTLADLTYSHLSNVNPLAASGAVNPQSVAGATAVPLPAGVASYLGVSAGAVGAYQPDGRHAWSEYTTLSEVFPASDNLPRSFSAAQDLRFERSWGRNAFTLDLLLNYLDASAPEASTGTVASANQTAGAQFLAGLKHDFSAYVVGTVGAGALVATSFSSGDVSIQPVAQATVRYQRGFALAQASLAQTSQIDPFLGQFLLTDVLSTAAYLALDQLERFHFVAFGSAQHGSVLTNDGLSTADDLLLGDLGLSYRPLQYAVVVSLDYNVLDQVGHQVGNVAFPSLHRQMALLTITGIWRSDTGLR